MHHHRRTTQRLPRSLARSPTEQHSQHREEKSQVVKRQPPLRKTSRQVSSPHYLHSRRLKHMQRRNTILTSCQPTLSNLVQLHLPPNKSNLHQTTSQHWKRSAFHSIRCALVRETHHAPLNSHHTTSHPFSLRQASSPRRLGLLSPHLSTLHCPDATRRKSDSVNSRRRQSSTGDCWWKTYFGVENNDDDDRGFFAANFVRPQFDLVFRCLDPCN